MTYDKINGVYKRYNKLDADQKELPPGKKWGDFIEGDFSIPEFGYLLDNEWEWTEKLDGTNLRIIYSPEDGGIELRGKKDGSDIPKGIEEWMDGWLESNASAVRMAFGSATTPVYMYLEGVGPKINRGRNPFRSHYEAVLLDVRIDGWWLDRPALKDLANEFNLDRPTSFGIMSLKRAIELISNGPLFESPMGDGGVQMEGIVGTPRYGLWSRNKKRIITKLKYCDFPRR